MVKLTEMKWKVNRLSENTNPFQLRSLGRETKPNDSNYSCPTYETCYSKKKVLTQLSTPQLPLRSFLPFCNPQYHNQNIINREVKVLHATHPSTSNS